MYKIEVKTRQGLHSSAKRQNRNSKSFEITQLEYRSMDVQVCYWFDYHAPFVVPEEALIPTASGHRIRINRDEQSHTLYGTSQKWLENWNLILDELQID